MASNNGYLTHCRICGTPIFSLGNRQFCSACYAQNRRNAAHRSNAEAKMRREQAKREKAQEPVQEQTATQEVGASVKKVNFQNVTNKPKLIVLDNRNRKQDGDTE